MLKDYVIDLIPKDQRTKENIEWFHSIPLVKKYIYEVESGECEPIKPSVPKHKTSFHLV
jgi:hypothetical protein